MYTASYRAMYAEYTLLFQDRQTALTLCANEARYGRCVRLNALLTAVKNRGGDVEAAIKAMEGVSISRVKRMCVAL